jgi:D-alanyl-D-alanine carboxypeptidase/D-alanyl-D-alanine-endopeptidase (penicillin-binding protein 4)
MAVDWMGQRMGSLQPEKSFTPASATKVVTAAVALDVLGPTFTYSTNVYGTVDPSGSVNDLFLVGGGDPVLTRAEYPATEKYATINGTPLEKLADAIVAAGVKRIAGAVVGVDNRYDNKRYIDVWPDAFHSTEAGPLGALVVDDGLLMGNELKPDDPAISAASELRVLLEARGVGVGAVSRHDPTPPNGKPIASVSSAPLTQIIQEMLVNSDNNTAELLLKEIGFSAKKIGSTEAGLSTVREKLSQWKIGSDSQLFDGSGLASGNRISCNTFISILTRFDTVLPNLLAVAGVSGTIRDAFTNESVNTVLRGKTGTLNGVKSLVGYLPIENSDPVIFSLIMNRNGIDNQSAYRPIWYSFANALNRAKATPRPEQLAP